MQHATWLVIQALTNSIVKRLRPRMPGFTLDIKGHKLSYYIRPNIFRVRASHPQHPRATPYSVIPPEYRNKAGRASALMGQESGPTPNIRPMSDCSAKD